MPGAMCYRIDFLFVLFLELFTGWWEQQIGVWLIIKLYNKIQERVIWSDYEKSLDSGELHLDIILTGNYSEVLGIYLASQPIHL
jgi:hypothetical protein